MLVKVSISKHRATVKIGNLKRQLSGAGGTEITSIIITGGSGGAAVRIIDSSDGANKGSTYNESFLVAANAGESTPFNPVHPILMTEGLFVNLVQGGGPGGNGEATIFYN